MICRRPALCECAQHEHKSISISCAVFVEWWHFSHEWRGKFHSKWDTLIYILMVRGRKRKLHILVYPSFSFHFTRPHYSLSRIRRSNTKCTLHTHSTQHIHQHRHYVFEKRHKKPLLFLEQFSSSRIRHLKQFVFTLSLAARKNQHFPLSFRNDVPSFASAIHKHKRSKSSDTHTQRSTTHRHEPKTQAPTNGHNLTLSMLNMCTSVCLRSLSTLKLLSIYEFYDRIMCNS